MMIEPLNLVLKFGLNPFSRIIFVVLIKGEELVVGAIGELSLLAHWTSWAPIISNDIYVLMAWSL